MKLVGATFTYAGHRYEPGDLFDESRLPAHQVPTFIRMYRLEDAPVRRKKKQETALEEISDEQSEDV